MSSFRNAFSSRAHKERAQPHDRQKFGLLEKHKDYVVRARAYHRKEETLRKLKEKAASRNPDEFYFKMINTKVVDGIHKPASQENKHSNEELMLMKTQDVGYVLQKIQSEKKKIERLTSVLHLVDNKAQNKHIYFAENRDELKEIEACASQKKNVPALEHLPNSIKRKTESSYKELEARKARLQDLTKVYEGMVLQQELGKKGRKRKLRDDEMVCPSTRPVYKWRAERKR